eukprot:gnl/TRDRNA2_/TRDRNA2_153800_c0_seq1.p1 gnl/TRDRNA2_/TRDRNA2_153800_c0~~gnl/TRDRNA2_/TRDRNA2_153800_c0_seq1.p1  ORF type:complete len:385 (+),score=74.06 gnl/TRDRNA2_/TRDRNA2_153800_c0_seq1:3-1157(+)
MSKSKERTVVLGPSAARTAAANDIDGHGGAGMPEEDVGNTVTTAFEELGRELGKLPLQSDGPSVSVEVSNRRVLLFSGGKLVPVQTIGCCHLEAADARITFRDWATAAEVVERVRGASARNDLSGVISSLLWEAAMPSWDIGSRAMDVSGVASLARLLWAAWLAREQREAALREAEAAARAKARAEDFEDLSQGWVVVHSVSPGIRDRVAHFQREMEALQAPAEGTPHANGKPSSDAAGSPGAWSASPRWLDELIVDLCRAAEQFHEVHLAPLGSSAAATSQETGITLGPGSSCCVVDDKSCAAEIPSAGANDGQDTGTDAGQGAGADDDQGTGADDSQCTGAVDGQNEVLPGDHCAQQQASSTEVSAGGGAKSQTSSVLSYFF